MDEILIVDIGGTKTTVSILAVQNNIPKVIFSEKFATLSSPVEEIKTIVSTVQKSNTKSKDLSLSLPGLWDSNGILRESNNLKKWIDFPFVNELKNTLFLKSCVFETDVICGGLGEYAFGFQDKFNGSLIYLNLGTGIGSSFIVDGKPFKSKRGNTLRLQKLLMQNGEELVSAIEYISGNSLKDISDSRFESVESLFENYLMADPMAIDIISKSQLQLAALIVNLFYIFTPDCFVLNGGLTNNWDVLCDGAIDIVHEVLGSAIEIKKSKLGETAPIYGAYINFYNIVANKSV